MSGSSNPNLDFGRGVDGEIALRDVDRAGKLFKPHASLLGLPSADMMELYDFLDAGGDSLLGILESGAPQGEARATLLVLCNLVSIAFAACQNLASVACPCHLSSSTINRRSGRRRWFLLQWRRRRGARRENVG